MVKHHLRQVRYGKPSYPLDMPSDTFTFPTTLPKSKVALPLPQHVIAVGRSLPRP